MEEGLVWLHAVRRRQRFADVNVSVARGRLRGLDADGNDGLSAAGHVERIHQDLLELLLVRNDMIGREDCHDARGRTRSYQCGPQRDRRTGVAANRLGCTVCMLPAPGVLAATVTVTGVPLQVVTPEPTPGASPNSPNT